MSLPLQEQLPYLKNITYKQFCQRVNTVSEQIHSLEKSNIEVCTILPTCPGKNNSVNEASCGNCVGDITYEQLSILEAKPNEKLKDLIPIIWILEGMPHD